MVRATPPPCRRPGTARGPSPRRRAFSRATESAATLTSVPTPDAFGNSLSSASRIAPTAGAEVGDAQRPRARTRSVDRGQRGLDHGFGLRPRHQRAGIDAQRQAPKFLPADDARDRLVREPALRQRGDGGSPRRSQAAGCRRLQGRHGRGQARQPTRMRASSSGESMPQARNFFAHSRRAAATVRTFWSAPTTISAARRHQTVSSAASSSA